MTITITTVQRMSILGIINAQKPKELDELLILRDLKDKVKLAVEEESTLIKTLPNGQVLIDWKAADGILPLCAEFERAEARKLQSLLDNWLKTEGLGVDDAGWYIPLVESVKAALSAAKRE